MARTARLKEHEGRTLPDLTPSAGVAPNSNGPDRDEFLFSIGHAKRLEDAISEARAVKKKFRNHLKLRGFNLAMMDLAIAEADREDGTTTANMRDFKRYAEFMNLPVGYQISIFDEPNVAAANDDLMARAFTEGRERGVKGEQPDEQKWLPVSPEGQEHQRGWNEGQAVNLQKFAALNAALSEAEKLAVKAEAKKGRKALKDQEAAEAEGDPAEKKAAKPRPGLN